MVSRVDEAGWSEIRPGEWRKEDVALALVRTTKNGVDTYSVHPIFGKELREATVSAGSLEYAIGLAEVLRRL